MNSETEKPFYQKLSLNLVSLSIIVLTIIYGKDILLPVLFSILLANLLLPLANYFARKKFNKPLSILFPLFLSIIVGASILYFLSTQVMNFIDDVPALKERVNEVGDSFQQWFKRNTGVAIWKQDQYIDNKVKDLSESVPDLVRLTFASVTEVLTYIVLVPLYTFLILYYRTRIKVFLISAFKNGSEKKVTDVLTESTTIAQRYLTGLLIETTLVFTLNTIGFFAIGIKYAVFLALLAALLNLIPYLGMIMANIICMFITLASSSETGDVLWVGVVLLVVQFFDNNFGMPLIVGNTVRINALATILGVLIGGALCGIPGMFLAIPGLAVLKVIFDKVPELQPWGIIIGDDQKEKSSMKTKLFSKKSK